MARRFQLRRDTAARWASANPVLAVGEPGFETDTGFLKVGDGATAWNALEYWRGGDALSAFSALTPAADRLPYYTGTSTAALAVVTAFARSLLAAGNAASARALLSAASSGDVATISSALTAVGNDLDALEAVALVDGDVGTTAGKLVALDGEAKLPAVDGSNLLNVGGSQGFIPYVFTASGTLTFPSGGRATAYVWGAGGGGGRGATTNYGQGGGGGALAIKTVQMGTGAVATVTVGSGGSGAAAGTGALAGSTGGASSVTGGGFGTVTAGGGLGGQAGPSSLAKQARAVATGGDVNLGGGRAGAVTAVRGASGGGGAAGIGEGRDSGDVTVASGASGGAGLAGNSANNSLAGGAAPAVIKMLFGMLAVDQAAGGAGSANGAASVGGPFSGGGGSGLGLSGSSSTGADGGFPGGGGGAGSNSGSAASGDGGGGLVIIVTDSPAVQA